jgi:uncharacterized protein YaaQ
MKLILAIVNNDDAHSVSTSLSREGFSVTKISSTGGFLMSGNSTFLMGVEDASIDRAMEIIAQNCKKREQVVPNSIAKGDPASLAREMTKVTVGGATVFVLNVEQFKQL